MDTPEETTALRWGSPPTAKAKNSVQRSVNALLDALAPERVLKRGDGIRGEIEQHRTPSGCILQAKDAAVTVSWFVDSRSQASLGELHVNVWRGVVSRGGASYRKAESATILTELVLVPIINPVDDCVWRARDGAEYDTAGIVAYCLPFVQEPIDGPI